jgi:glycosyltransferase involved in cell wall biosynthesis
MVKKLFSQLHRPVVASDVYRSISPAKFLGPVLRDYGVQLLLQYDFTLHPDLAATIIKRHMPAELLIYLMAKQSSGTRLAYDTDDDMMSIPKWSPAYPPEQQRNETLAARMVADKVWVTTRTLSNAVDAWGPAKATRSIVLPNLIDLDSWGGGDDHPKDDKVIRICWAGTATHDKDVELLSPVLDAILPKYPHVQFIYFGEELPEWMVGKWFDRVVHSEWVALSRYPDRLRYLSPHIFLCPLVDERFCHGKSAIKAFEATLAGAAVICSPLPPYQIEHEPIWGFASVTAGWIERISELIEDREKRQRQHGKALEVVSANWSWQHSKYSQLWLAAMLDLVEYKKSVEQPAKE